IGGARLEYGDNEEQQGKNQESRGINRAHGDPSSHVPRAARTARTRPGRKPNILGPLGSFQKNLADYSGSPSQAARRRLSPATASRAPTARARDGGSGTTRESTAMAAKPPRASSGRRSRAPLPLKPPLRSPPRLCFSESIPGRNWF